MKPFLKRYASELGSAKFLVLLLVKYFLDVSFRCGTFRWTNLDVKWSSDSLHCFNDRGIPLYYLGSIFLFS